MSERAVRLIDIPKDLNINYPEKCPNKPCLGNLISVEDFYEITIRGEVVIRSTSKIPVMLSCDACKGSLIPYMPILRASELSIPVLEELGEFGMARGLREHIKNTNHLMSKTRINEQINSLDLEGI